MILSKSKQPLPLYRHQAKAIAKFGLDGIGGTMAFQVGFLKKASGPLCHICTQKYNTLLNEKKKVPFLQIHPRKGQ